MKLIKKVLGALMCLVFMVSATGCSSVTNGKRIVRVATMQSETHPEYLGLLKFKEYVEKEKLEKYNLVELKTELELKPIEFGIYVNLERKKEVDFLIKIIEKNLI